MTAVVVGELRPSQLLYTFGVGAIIDLPNLSVMTLGLDYWDAGTMNPISEDRLLAAVRRRLGPQVERLLGAPATPDTEGGGTKSLDLGPPPGVPVVSFPRWLVCPACRRLAPISQGSFELRPNRYHRDRTGYVHAHCPDARKYPPTVFPARFLMACAGGHLDDFPWNYFVHGGVSACPGPFKLYEIGPSGEARDVEVACSGCGSKQRMARAFGDEGPAALPACRGRRVHLLDEESEACHEVPRAMLIGASNLWFPAAVSVLSVPVSGHRVEQLVSEVWNGFLDGAANREVLAILLKTETPQARKLRGLDLEAVWAAVERKRAPKAEPEGPVDLRAPEWELFSTPGSAPSSNDFRLREVLAPRGFESWFERVVLVERLREVQALTGFTRVESPGDAADTDVDSVASLVPLGRRALQWVPATEARGEGLFLQIREEAVRSWVDRHRNIAKEFFDAHREWRKRRGIEPPEASFLGLRYALIHSLSHALVRELSLECGYSAAALRERLYAREPGAEGGPMAGLLLYTAAPDSEGTLGGLVRQGQPDALGQHLRSALRAAGLCSSDPLCAEFRPSPDGRLLHGAACHACLFSPETFCERGNRYLDRLLLVRGVAGPEVAFFEGLEA